ncbi:AAA family ATPase [Bradyrhizobium ottawaense]|uniref:nucleotide-binding protein n=1 Tax=Bradyrhizobium ottawaense TaxID=931866 RepID=UPI003BEEE39C
MHTIVLATQKGGSGKSTLAIGLALAAKQAGFTVRLIETDPQGTLSNWQRRRTADDLVVEPIYHAADIEPRLKMLADSGLQLAIVDTAAGLSAATSCNPPFRSLPDPGPPERRRHRGDRLDAQRRTRLEAALQLRVEPDADPRPAHRQRRQHPRRGSGARSF